MPSGAEGWIALILLCFIILSIHIMLFDEKDKDDF